MRKKNTLLGVGLAATTLVAAWPLVAAEMPKTMEEMWRIIEAQQKEIEALKAKSQRLEEEVEEETEGETFEETIETREPREVSTPPAAEESVQTQEQVKELEHKTDVLAEAVEKLRTQLYIPEEFEYKSMYGLGPAASKVYQVNRGLSIGGYGEGRYQTFVNGDKADNADFLRLVLYAGYRFTDRIIFNSEIEFEHASTGKDGSVSVEFAALDFLLDPRINVRAGLVLLPMGFLNPIHEPPFFFGNLRPEVEQRILPSTWRENGVGFFGEILPGLTYTTYVVNGLDASGFTSNGIRDGRQSGSKALAEDLAFVGRLDYAPPKVPGLTFGGSAYVGNSGQDQIFGGQELDVFTQLYEGHIQWQYRGWWFRALGAWGHIDDADKLSAARREAGLADDVVGENNFGWYTELAYNVLPLVWPETTQYLAPFFRFEQLDTIASAPTGFADNGAFDRNIYQFGINYKPIPNVVIKADYRNFEAQDGRPADEFNLGLGFIF